MRIGTSAILTLDPVIALLCGLAAGLVAFSVATSPPLFTGAREGTEPLDAPLALDPVLPSLSSYAGWIGRAFSTIAPLSAILAFYTLGLEREQGYSLIGLLYGESRLRYYASRIAIPWLAYSTAVSLGALTGIALNDTLLVAFIPWFPALLALLAFYIASLQLTISYVANMVFKRSLLALLASIAVLYVLTITGLWLKAIPVDIASMKPVGLTEILRCLAAAIASLLAMTLIAVTAARTLPLRV